MVLHDEGYSEFEISIKVGCNKTAEFTAIVNL